MPIFLSQAADENENKFEYYNDLLRGTKTDMFSATSPAVADVLILGRPFMAGYLLFGPSRGLTFDWYGRLVALMLISFEFCMLISNKNKLVSLCGMLLITFSAATQWWNSNGILIWGMLALLLIDKFMLSKEYKTKILCALGLFISGISYVFMMYPAWQIPYAYIYLAVLIWIIWKNRKDYKFNWKDALIIFLVLISAIGIGARYYMMSHDALNAVMNTDYPGERFEIGGDAKKIIYSYVYSFLFPYISVNNPSELAGMISLFPIPMILALVYVFRNREESKQNLVFIIPLLILSTVFGVWTHVPTNEIFARITLLYMVPATRMAVPLGFIQILIMVYLLSHVNKNTKLFGKKTVIALTIIIEAVIMYLAKISDSEGILTPFRLIICGVVLLIQIYLLLNINKENYKKWLIYILIGISIITGATVNPIQRGISVMRNKPVAKEVQKIVTEDRENNLWLVDSTSFYIPNYILASGAKVINSVNVYPNQELFDIVLEEDSKLPEVRQIYNRYAHITVEITDSENKVELLFGDSIKLYISVDKVDELKVGYILTTRGLEEFNNEKIKFEQVYNEDGLAIYKVVKL